MLVLPFGIQQTKAALAGEVVGRDSLEVLPGINPAQR